MLSRSAWHKLRLCCTRLFAARAIYRSICDCCVCPIDSTRLQRPAWHKLRLCCTRLFAARAIHRAICVTSPTNCPIELRPNSAALGIMQVNLPSALACTNFHHDVVRGALFTSPTSCPTHHGGCCRAERFRSWCLQWYY